MFCVNIGGLCVCGQLPLTFAQAIEIANRELLSLSSGGVELKLLSGKAEEFDVGWVFYYQSARYIETGDFSESVAGNAPLFVSRSDGRPFFISYHRPLAESVAAYRACGNPNAQEVPEVSLTGWRKGALAVSAIQAVRQHSAIGLAQAKSAVESCLASESSIIPVPSVAEAKALFLALASAGFEARVRYDG
jgi:ribosomal protein L7/L12